VKPQAGCGQQAKGCVPLATWNKRFNY